MAIAPAALLLPAWSAALLGPPPFTFLPPVPAPVASSLEPHPASIVAPAKAARERRVVKKRLAVVRVNALIPARWATLGALALVAASRARSLPPFRVPATRPRC